MADMYGDMLFFHQNSRRTHPRNISSVKSSEKVNIYPLCRPSPPLFLLLLPNPNSPHLNVNFIVFLVYVFC